MKHLKKLAKAGIFCSCLAITLLVAGQENPNSVLSKGIKYKFNDSSSIAFHINTQVWLRYMQPNPGTVDAAGEPVDEFFDIGLRRTRFSMYGSFLNDKFVLYGQLGMNSQTFSSSAKPQLYIHDIWTAYNLGDGKVYVGMGLHGWAGISRFSSVSSVKNIMLDHPGFTHANLGKTDQSGRQLGIFLKGNIAKVNYRFSVDKPFLLDERTKMDINESSYYPSGKLSYRGYAFYSFLDEEKYKSSYGAMGYLGSKKIFNIGAGFDYHPEVMASLNTDSSLVKHDKILFGFDAFLDYPFGNHSVLTAYTVFYKYDFGPNNIRTYGAMNPLKSGSLEQGGGNNHFNIGTGNILYGMLGYILPDALQPFSGKIQTVAAVHYKDFEALNEPSLQFDAGINYYISGHNAKFTLQYSNWAVYSGASGNNSNATVDSHKSMLVLQCQMYL